MYIHTLKTGRKIFIDVEDKHYIDKYIINTMRTAHAHTRYIVCKDLITRKYAGLFHRIILNITDRNIEIDHINGNGLDCRKDNLRLSNDSLNQQNRRLTIIENEVKGIFYRKDRYCWSAKITVNGKVIHLGHFLDKEDAIVARLNAEDFYFPHKGDGTGQLPEITSVEF